MVNKDLLMPIDAQDKVSEGQACSTATDKLQLHSRKSKGHGPHGRRHDLEELGTRSSSTVCVYNLAWVPQNLAWADEVLELVDD